MKEIETSLKALFAMVRYGGDEVLGMKTILGKKARESKIET